MDGPVSLLWFLCLPMGYPNQSQGQEAHGDMGMPTRQGAQQPVSSATLPYGLSDGKLKCCRELYEP